MKHWFAWHALAVPLFVSGPSAAQYGTMMDPEAWGDHWMGGFGGMWVPTLLAIAVGAGVVWVILQQRK